MVKKSINELSSSKDASCLKQNPESGTITKLKRRIKTQANGPINKKLKSGNSVRFTESTENIIHNYNPTDDYTEYDELEFNEESGRQDNTPKSLKKKSKKQKKKNNVKSDEDSKKSILANIEYVNKWKNDRTNWKFEKIKQSRLISNMFDQDKLPEKTFPIFIEYMTGASGNIKKLVLSKANEVITEMEKWCELSEEEKSKTDKVDENKYERARTLIQFLE